MDCYRSPNNGTAGSVWPEYSAPDWNYLDLRTEGEGGFQAGSKISKQCRFWNELIPSLYAASLKTKLN